MADCNDDWQAFRPFPQPQLRGTQKDLLWSILSSRASRLSFHIGVNFDALAERVGSVLKITSCSSSLGKYDIDKSSNSAAVVLCRPYQRRRGDLSASTAADG
jgi:hypothetical protein